MKEKWEQLTFWFFTRLTCVKMINEIILSPFPSHFVFIFSILLSILYNRKLYYFFKKKSKCNKKLLISFSHLWCNIVIIIWEWVVGNTLICLRYRLEFKNLIWEYSSWLITLSKKHKKKKHEKNKIVKEWNEMILNNLDSLACFNLLIHSLSYYPMRELSY